jgi:simple sugar transport system permease protein
MGAVNKLGKYVPAYVESGWWWRSLWWRCLLHPSLDEARPYVLCGRRQLAERHHAGVKARRTKFIAYLMCSLLAGIGGFVYFLHVGSGSPSHATGAEMNAIASSIIGGTMLTGGVGNIIGTLFGVLSLSTIKNIVTSLGLDEAWWTNITVAIMICLFLVVQSLVLNRKHGAKKGDAQ